MSLDLIKLGRAAESWNGSPPGWLLPGTRHVDRTRRIDEPRTLDSALHARVLSVQKELDFNSRIFAHRRSMESAVAHYLHSICHHESCVGLGIDRLADEMSACRHSGIFGCREDGKPIVIWDRKCECGLLCPDEINLQRDRLVERYLPPLLSLQHSGYRIYKAVFSWPNARPGELRTVRKAMFFRFAEMLKARYPGRGGGKIFTEIVGAQIVDECPLGKNDDWNLHLNVMLVVNGYLDFKKLRDWWHWQIEIQSPHEMRKLARERMRARGLSGELTDDVVLRFAFSEILKYPAKLVAKMNIGGFLDHGKNCQAKRRRTAPPLNEWPAERFAEWYEAHHRHRRLRSYGLLFRIGKEPEREPPAGEIEWLGRIRWNGRSYDLSLPWLDLKPLGDNYSPGERESSTGPPSLH